MRSPLILVVNLVLRVDVNQAVTVVSPRMGTQGWPFANVDFFPNADVDPLYKAEHVKDLYLKADQDYRGRFVARRRTQLSQSTPTSRQIYRSYFMG